MPCAYPGIKCYHRIKEWRKIDMGGVILKGKYDKHLYMWSMKMYVVRYTIKT